MFICLFVYLFRVYTAGSSSQAAVGFGDAGYESGLQFRCISIDSGGEILAAGAQGVCFSVFVWSVRTAKLLEELAAHEAPVVSLQFHPHPDKQGILATGSWDKTVRVRYINI